MGLTFNKEADIPDNVIGYIDFDFAGSKTNWKLTRGYVFILVGAAISYLSKLQLIIILSIYEAGKIAICKARKETIWLEYLLAEIGFWKRFTPVRLYANNQDSIMLTNNLKFYYQIKHIDIKFH